MLILRQVIGYQAGKRTVPISADPHLKAELNQTKKDLHQILNKWKFGDTPITSSQEFLANFEPWINKQLEAQKELKTFLAKKGLTNLKEADSKLTNRDLSENEELNQLRQELTEKEQTFLNTEQDYLRQIEELREEIANLQTRETENPEELTAELDQLKRDKNELEQELLATNNQLRNKQQEVTNKEKTLEQLKKEASEKELSLNKKLTEKNKEVKEKNGLITTLQGDINELKKKYSKQGQLLDTEQLECKKLEEENEKLQAEIQQLKGGTN